MRLMGEIYKQIITAQKQGKRLLAILLDPDKVDCDSDTLDRLIGKIALSGATHIFIGGSLLFNDQQDKIIGALQEKLMLPILLFPGNAAHITNRADGILFLSLISGRNPEYLIGQHVQAAPLLKQSGLEVISTGYILIESGKQTTVSYISGTTPVPNDKPEIAVATALAGEMIGHKMIYLEAGSGAQLPVPLEMVRLVSENIDIPLIVGGGIRSKVHMEQVYQAGATMVVIGTAFEKDVNFFSDL